MHRADFLCPPAHPSLACGALGLSYPPSRASRSKRPRHVAQPGRILASPGVTVAVLAPYPRLGVKGLSARTRTASHPSARNTGSEPRVLSATYTFGSDSSGSVAVSRDLHLVADRQFTLPLTHNCSNARVPRREYVARCRVPSCFSFFCLTRPCYGC
ncbi:hypothetical protein EXIGLDRAFT_724446 [Exidia glandulosa HHB12029]|uniref:Uncharacterized protein n=1 Tax=Exidia glandulosa HHB12029 TaxID=1314781 RepID=A0A165EER2_EXIGL|nr:hypothetical protein EXIGLDRAFT_724446 [Exidia glandulosa HHB12029]